MTSISEVREQLRAFVSERQWEKFHSPKNLAAGLSTEAAELLEIFVWLSEDESRSLNEKQLARVREEIGDIQLYVINLSEKFGLDPIQYAADKLVINEHRYPAHLVIGSAKKYDQYR